MRLIEFRLLTKGALRGFATVELPNGLIIRDISVLVGRNGAWANLPAKPVLNRDGSPRLGTNGRALYNPILEWNDRSLSDRFSAALIDLVRAAHPGALADAA